MELQPIGGVLEMSAEKCGSGVNDWEMMFSESAASTNQEQTFLRWIMDDIDDTSTGKHHHHQLQQELFASAQAPLLEYDAGVGGLGFGLVDPGLEFEVIGEHGRAASVSATSASCIGSSQRNSKPALSPPLSIVLGGKNVSFVNPPTIHTSSSSHPGMFSQEPTEEKPHLQGQHLLLNSQQQDLTSNAAVFLPLLPYAAETEQQQTQDLLLPHQPKRHLSLLTDPDCCNQNSTFPQPQPATYKLQQRQTKFNPSTSGDENAANTFAAQQQQHHALVDQLFKAAELVEAGNFVSAHGILARLNQQLASPLGKPLLRSAYYFKEALQFLIASSSSLSLTAASSPSTHCRVPSSTPLSTPFDVVLKLSAYKAFSEVSPILHFTNFTITQTLLEELGTTDRIHIVDFDIGIGGQWSSFMQGLAQRRAPAIPLLKLTAFIPPCFFHPLELHLTRENLSNFAAELNIPFEVNICGIDSFDPAEILAASAGRNEAIAVNLPVGGCFSLSFSQMLRLVKQLLPRIVISVDQGFERSDLPFSHHMFHAYQSAVVLLDSIDSAGSNLDMANKIERFVLQPRIENCVIGRYHAADKMLPWRTLLASAGFLPLQFSNFTETQAECLLKRVQIRGFHVEKHLETLCLYWQRGELVSISAWRC
ncbi:hypothetical protein HPP92_022314 [Vanilla planifolia]|uniref:Scarecrow-like protein 6 n=1 Tax=Vanilla planifolia TaxID=51239 RepID=A0A835PT97_VANPL|nr:hypothetical protein HPP92_022314 [Vanilla planifolia]